MPSSPTVVPQPEELLLGRAFSELVLSTPPGAGVLARLRVLAAGLSQRLGTDAVTPAMVIGAATLQACLRGLVDRFAQAHPDAMAAVAADLDATADLASDFRLGGLGADPPGRLAALLVVAALRDNPALAPLAPVWSEPSPQVAARRDAARQAALAALSSTPLPGLELTLAAALLAPTRAGSSLRDQLVYVGRHLAAALPPGAADAALLASDLLAEEQTARLSGPGPVAAPYIGPGGPPGPQHGGGFDPGSGPGSGPGFDPGPAQDDLDAPQAAFSEDRDWMPDVVMIAKQALVWLDQLSRSHGRAITRLDEVPDSELDLLAGRGFNCLWLIGLWERSHASQVIKRRMGNPQAEASAYALYDYVIAERLGGEAAWIELSRRAGERGLRLASDMVPNHTGIDGRWVVDHPDWFVQLPQPPYPSYRFDGPDLCEHPDVSVHLEDGYWDHSDAAVVFKHYDHRTGDTRFIYHGNDGTQMPWNDTAQLDYMNPQVREAVIQTILAVARRFPVIRFDAAMTLARRHVQRLWHPVPGSAGAVPSRAEHGASAAEFAAAMPVEFWREVVDRVAAEAPDTLLLAEAFWMMEAYFVRTLGMHRVYNSAFMHMLRDEDIAGFKGLIRDVLAYSPGILERFVHFVNNPDEDTAVAQFGKGDKYFGVTTVMATLPGLPMFGHGQIEGFEEKYGMEYARAYRDEQPDQGFVDHHEAVIFPLLRRRHLFSGVEHFALFDLVSEGGAAEGGAAEGGAAEGGAAEGSAAEGGAAGEGAVVDSVLAYSNMDGDDRSLVLFNDCSRHVAGWIRTSAPINLASIDDDARLHTHELVDALALSRDGLHALRRQHDGLWFLRSGAELGQRGIYVELGPYQAQVFMEWRTLGGAGWAALAGSLGGAGVADLEQALAELQATGEEGVEEETSCRPE